MSSYSLGHYIKNNPYKSHYTSKFEFDNNLFYFKKHFYVLNGEA